MDAGRALKELTEVSSQIEAAVLVAADGSLLASTLEDDGASERFARAARDLAETAEAAPRSAGEGPLVQLEVALLAGSVFVVREEERLAAAVTTPAPTAGLVFYDLKSCLRAAAHADGGKPRPRARRRTETRAETGDSAA